MKISFISGVYNSEKYLKKCIDCMLKQTFQNIEILLIVNASVDNSENIVREYEKNFPQIVKGYYFDEKLGAGGSRGYGLKKATGDYIAFVDNDDLLNEDYLSKMVDVINQSEKMVDIVTCDFMKITQDEKDILYTRKFHDEKESLLQSVAPWAKLYRREFLLNNNLIPRNIPFGEDVIFTSDVYMSGPVVRHCKYVGYLWRDNLTSTSHTELAGFPPRTLELSVSYWKEMYTKHFSTQKEYYGYFLFKYYMWYLLNSGRNVDKQSMMLEYRKIMEFMNDQYADWNNFKNNKVIIKGERNIVSLVLVMLRLMKKIGILEWFFNFYCQAPLGKLWPSL